MFPFLKGNRNIACHSLPVVDWPVSIYVYVCFSVYKLRQRSLRIGSFLFDKQDKCKKNMNVNEHKQV